MIRIQDTPNPSAWKFVLDRPVLLEGKATFSTAEEAAGNRLALDLLDIDGVKQLHFFQNVITVTAKFDADADMLHRQVLAVIETRLPAHNPALNRESSRAALRADLPPERRKIEEILDETIRPGLQGDGGDIAILRYEDKKLYVHYEGACGTCPSATTGTLMAIEGILRDQFDPEIQVIPM